MTHRRDKQRTKIAVFGAGYVGLTTAVLLACAGYKVSLVETNDERLSVLKSGKSFFYEEGIDNLLAEGIKNKSIELTNRADEGMRDAGVLFSCVGTPDKPDGSTNLQYVFDVAKSAAKQAISGAVFVQKSTVPVGTGDKIEKIFSESGNKLKYVSNPEFLREGTAIIDSLWPDRVVVGGNDSTATEKILDIYRTIDSQRDDLAKRAGLAPRTNVISRSIKTGLNSAELIKVTSNAFLALKISFANSIAKLADQANADISEVMDAVGADSRIARSFLNAGRGYGGGCFPKDVSGLISSAEEYGVDMPLLVAATDINDSMPRYIAKKLEGALGTLKNKNVTVLGLAFKAGTSDARKSPGVAIANIIAAAGGVVVAYDPYALKEAKKDIVRGVSLEFSLEKAVVGAEAIIVATDWPEFLEYNLSVLAKSMSGSLFIDAVNAFDPDMVRRAGMQYLGVGRR